MRPTGAVLLAVGLVLAGGCTSVESETATPTPTPTEQSTPKRTQRPSPSGGPKTKTKAPPKGASVPRQCIDVVSPTAVLEAVGVALPGGTSYVFADDFPESDRTARITCGYGVERRGTALELAVSGYTGAPAAREQVDATVAAARDDQRVRALPVLERPGYLLSDRQDTSYVVQDGARTVVATLRRGVVPDPAVRVALLEIVTAVLRELPAQPAGG